MKDLVDMTDDMVNGIYPDAEPEEHNESGIEVIIEAERFNERIAHRFAELGWKDNNWPCYGKYDSSQAVRRDCVSCPDEGYCTGMEVNY